MQHPDHLVWMDLEMTGLEPEQCTILEIATLVTDANLDLVAEGPALVIHQPDGVLEAMDDWNREHHGASGLLQRSRQSTVSLAQAEQQTLAFIQLYSPHRTSPLCGNSVHQDRRFLARYMPAVERYLHYRNVDVSTLKELVRRWYPADPPFEKKHGHLALDDIRESIAELRYYRERYFR